MAREQEVSPLLSRVEEGASTPDIPAAASPSPWTARRGLAVVAITAVVGAAAVWGSSSSTSAAGGATTLAGKKHTLGSTAQTFSFGDSELSLLVQETPLTDISEKTTTVYVDSKGIPPHFVEFANAVSSLVTKSHVQSLSLSSSTTNYAPAGRKLAAATRPNDANGVLATRSTSTESVCNQTLVDGEQGHFGYECTLAHAHSDDFGTAIVAIYKGFFQIFKEVFAQMSSPGAVSNFMSGQWDMAADDTTVVLKVHPDSDYTSTSWKIVAQGAECVTAAAMAQAAVEFFAVTLDPSADKCTTEKKGQVSTVECTTSMSTSAGLVMGIDSVMQALPMAI